MDDDWKNESIRIWQSVCANREKILEIEYKFKTIEHIKRLEEAYNKGVNDTKKKIAENIKIIEEETDPIVFGLKIQELRKKLKKEGDE